MEEERPPAAAAAAGREGGPAPPPLGNQLNGARLVDEGLRAMFKAAYPDVEVQPPSPPRSSAMEVDSVGAQLRNSFGGGEPIAQGTSYLSQEKPSHVDLEMTG